MKRHLISLAVIALAVASTLGQTRYVTYSNERFAYSIQYPFDLLKMQPPPANGDGREFLSKDRSVKMLVWGNDNASEKTWQEQYESDLKDFVEKPSYTVMKNDWYVISGLKEGKIYYQKTLRRTLKQKTGDMDVFFTFTIEYPDNQRSKLDPIVQRIVRSFKCDPTADV